MDRSHSLGMDILRVKLGRNINSTATPPLVRNGSKDHSYQQQQRSHYFPEIASRPQVSISNAVSLLKLCGTEILDPMQAFVYDRRVTSTNVLPHPHLRDVRSFSFAADFTCYSWFYSYHSCYTTFLYFNDELNHFNGRFRPPWPTWSPSPRDYAQVPNNWLIFLG